MSGKTRSWWE